MFLHYEQRIRLNTWDDDGNDGIIQRHMDEVEGWGDDYVNFNYLVSNSQNNDV